MNNLDLFSTTNAMQTNPQGDDRGGDVSVRCGTTDSPRSGDPRSFFNTTRLDGDELAQAKRRVSAQNDVILAVFQQADTPLGPWEVMHRCHAAGHAFLIGSVRRAVTTLTKQGALQKLPTKRRGDAGAMEFEWAVAA